MKYLKSFKIFESMIKCRCGWKWKLSEGGSDPYICHKCGNNNKKS